MLRRNLFAPMARGFFGTILLCSLNTGAFSQATDRDLVLQKLGQPREMVNSLPSAVRLNVIEAKLEQILPAIEYPWAFEFLNESEILLTQHGGTLSRISLKTGSVTHIQGLPTIATGTGQMGLFDVELHPNFKKNNLIYLSYAKPHSSSNQYSVIEVAAARLQGGNLVDLRPLLNYDRYSWSPSNFGGALEFDQNGYLYITVGDRAEDTGSTRLGSHLEGKLLRVMANGQAPPSNPFIDSDEYDPRIFSVGLRNAQGLHYDYEADLLVEAEHGPRGGDEINIMKPGRDYGYPTVTYGAYYADAKPFGKGTHLEGTDQPIFYFLPSIAASKIMIYRGEMFPEWHGDIFVTALGGQHVAKLDLDGNIVRSSHGMLEEVGGRIRDIKEAPDGSLYILSQTHGLKRLYRDHLPSIVKPREAPDGKIEPPMSRDMLSDAPFLVREPADQASDHPGKRPYVWACGGCHDPGAGSAPSLGNADEWRLIMAQNPRVTRDHVMFGYKSMPARGFCNTCRPDELFDAVGYMFEEAAKNFD